jgi:Ribbon-helix-helix protein, copG family
MAIKKKGRTFGKQTAAARRAGSSTSKTPVALTLKVDDDTYIRLSMLRATQRRTSQDILRQALEEYLDRTGA